MTANEVYNQLSDRYQRLVMAGADSLFSKAMGEIQDRLGSLARFLQLQGPADVALAQAQTVSSNLSPLMTMIEAQTAAYKAGTAPQPKESTYDGDGGGDGGQEGVMGQPWIWVAAAGLGAIVLFTMFRSKKKIGKRRK